MESLSTDEVDIRVIHAGVGAIYAQRRQPRESASNAVLIGFNIRPDETAKRQAENEGVDLRFYQVIYEVENDLKKAMVGMLAPKFREVIARPRRSPRGLQGHQGRCDRRLLRAPAASSRATPRSRVIRDSAVVFDGELESLRRFKDDVREVAEGFECGVQVAKFQDLKEGDVIEAYATEQVAAELVRA